MKVGAVVIGRNEGERLRLCLNSVSEVDLVVYVDSCSTDGSAQLARERGVEVIELDPRIPLTAARARNAGFDRLRDLAGSLTYVQFIDGDCELIDGWLERAVSFLDSRPGVGVVCGRLRERFPDRSVYNWLCDIEWDREGGEVRACGGIATVRADAFEALGGFRADLIAGEEPELCVRLRAAGWHIWRLCEDMAFHDAAIIRFSQWWLRCLRGGYASAQGAYLHGAPPERHFVWESRRAWFWGILLPLACLTNVFVFGPWGSTALLIYPAQALRQTVRNRGPLRGRATLALFQVLARFPEGLGQLKFMRDRILGHQAPIIEYK